LINQGLILIFLLNKLINKLIVVFSNNISFFVYYRLSYLITTRRSINIIKKVDSKMQLIYPLIAFYIFYCNCLYSCFILFFYFFFSSISNFCRSPSYILLSHLSVYNKLSKTPSFTICILWLLLVKSYTLFVGIYTLIYSGGTSAGTGGGILGSKN